jgi:uncharacterized phiE125 gp8 family phage protein
VKSLVRVTDAESEPVTLAEAQAFLRVDSDDDAALIETLITTARQVVEDFTGRALISQEWQLVVSEWPSYCSALRQIMSVEQQRTIVLDRSPLISVETLKYYPASGAAQATLSSTTYHVMTGPTPGLVILKSTEDWPDIFDRPDAVEVNFTAGYADADAVPKPLRQCVLLLLSHLYENRGAINIGNIVNELPFSLKFLLEAQRVGGHIA